MGKAYSVDLREKVIDLVKNKKWSVTKVSTTMNIGRTTIYHWLKRDDLTPITPPGRPSSFHNLEGLRGYLIEHPKAIGPELCRHFNITTTVLYSSLKKLGYSFKKKHYGMSKPHRESKLYS